MRQSATAELQMSRQGIARGLRDEGCGACPIGDRRRRLSARDRAVLLARRYPCDGYPECMAMWEPSDTGMSRDEWSKTCERTRFPK